MKKTKDKIRPEGKIIAGIDLHNDNLVIGLINQEGKRSACQKLDCDLPAVVKFLQPYKTQLQSLAVESTFNWYWLVDGLQALDYPIVLANPAQIKQYSGIKHTNDQHDAFYLAELQRLNCLPKAYIYDAQLRPVRDLLRRRMKLVHQRTALLLSLKSLHARTLGKPLPLGELKAMAPEDALNLFEHPANQLIANLQLRQVKSLGSSIEVLEKAVLECAEAIPLYTRLLTLPGIGRILGMTITMEVGEISRFKTDGDFASYCRTVAARRLSNGKQKGENNSKCGNKYLSWAFVEAANFARRTDAYCRRWYDRKAAKTNAVLAIKALACKLAKAAWHLMKHQTAYDEKRMFPELALKAD